MRSDHPAHRSFWVSIKKCTSHFDPLEPEKRPKRPVFGHQRKKPNRRLRWHRNFGRFGTHLYPVALFVSELRPVFRRESVFTPDEYVFTGLVVRMYRFDVTAGALRAPAGKTYQCVLAETLNFIANKHINAFLLKQKNVIAKNISMRSC